MMMMTIMMMIMMMMMMMVVVNDDGVYVDLTGFDDHGRDPAEHVGGEGAESLHEVGVLCTRAGGCRVILRRRKKERGGRGEGG